MYKVVYYIKRTEGLTLKEQEYKRYENNNAKFRLRRNALHYITEIVRSEYIKNGYATEAIVGGIYCYKSEKTANGDREITEMLIKAEKV
jgi:hypothetical protein